MNEGRVWALGAKINLCQKTVRAPLPRAPRTPHPGRGLGPARSRRFIIERKRRRRQATPDTRGSDTVHTRYARKEGHSNGDELREALRELYAGVTQALHAGALTPRLQWPRGLALDLAVVVRCRLLPSPPQQACILSIPKHCVAHLVEGEELWRWAAEALIRRYPAANSRSPLSSSLASVCRLSAVCLWTSTYS